MRPASCRTPQAGSLCSPESSPSSSGVSSIELEKLFCGFGSCFCDFLKRNAACRRDCFGDDECVSRFAAFPSIRDRREIRAICFHHELPERHLRRHVTHVRSVFESHNASERNQIIKIENFVCLFERAAEAMEHPPHPS